MFEKARDLMRIGVRTVAKDASIYEAIRILVDHRISGLPVTDGDKMVGMITEKDVLRLVFHEERLPGPIEAYMTRRIVAFEEEDDLEKIWSCLIHNPYRRVPILRRGQLTGIITRTDLIQAHAADFGPESPSHTPGQDGAEPLVHEVMTAGLLTTTPERPVGEAVRILVAHHITGVPVVDDAMRLVGILTEKDVLSLLDVGSGQALRGPACSWRVGEVMTRNVTSFNANDSLFDVCECLAHNSFRRVPILDGGKLVGIVSRADLVLYILKNRSILFQRQPLIGVC
jgi:CBS domain-containing protein